MIKSPLRYPGGKSKAVNLIASLVSGFDEFREPFLGGGSVFIYLKQRFPKKKFWVNDLHFNLFKIQADKKTSGITAGCVSKFPSSPQPPFENQIVTN